VVRGETKVDDVHVALLRGINVGGKNRLPMKDLVAMFLDDGCLQVRTYIQSGNVVFRAPPARVLRIPAAIAKALSARFGFSVPVVTRTAAEIRAIARGNPFLRTGADTKSLHVAFLAGWPSPASVAKLDPARSPPDEIVLRGREIYLRLPNGVARSKFTNAYFDGKLGTTSTVRNWATVLALVELLG